MTIDANLTVLDLIRPGGLLHRFFAEASWRPWWTFLAYVFGLGEPDADLDLLERCTGQRSIPATQARAAWLFCGRRAGKSRTSALIAIFMAFFRRWPNLVPGEQGRVMVLAVDKSQAQVIMSYARAMIEDTPTLAREVASITAEEIALKSGISIVIKAANFRSVRGPTCLAVLCDEIAWWFDTETSKNPAGEILRALRPAMATAKGSLMLALSSPAGKIGIAWDAHRKHFGQPGDERVWQAASKLMNDTIDDATIAAAYESDPQASQSEWGGLFRDDLSGYVDPERLERMVRPNPLELPPVEDARYFAFSDPSGGTHDEFVLGIAHQEKSGRVVVNVIDAVTAPLNPHEAVRRHAEICKRYRVRTITTDRYSAEWNAQAWRDAGLEHRTSDLTKSEIYLAILAKLNTELCELPPDKRMVNQFAQLQRRVRSGRESVDHVAGGSDDRSNACAGAIWLAMKPNFDVDTRGAKLFAVPNVGSLLGEDTKRSFDQPLWRRGG